MTVYIFTDLKILLWYEMLLNCVVLCVPCTMAFETFVTGFSLQNTAFSFAADWPWYPFKSRKDDRFLVSSYYCRNCLKKLVFSCTAYFKVLKKFNYYRACLMNIIVTLYFVLIVLLLLNGCYFLIFVSFFMLWIRLM